MGNSSNSRGDRLLIDSCPRQNSELALKTLDHAKVKVFSISPRSPDLNRIKNFFILVNVCLREDVISLKITFAETFAEFSERTKQTMLSFSSKAIDK